VRRNAVVVLSDGGDEHSLATFADTLGATWAETVPIFAVAIGDALVPRRRGVLRPGTRWARSFRRRRDLAEALAGRLEHLAHISGGRLIVGEDRASLSQSFDTVVAMLRSSYLVGYRPSEGNDGVRRGGLTWYPVELQVPGREVDVFARPGYYRRSVDTRAAQRIVRQSREAVSDGSAPTAIAMLDVAAQLDPGYWPVYLQQARAQVRLGDLAAARDALLRANELHPGLVPVHELLAEVARDLGEFDLAWRHAIRAYQGGAQAGSLLRELEALAAPPENLQTQLRAARAFVDIGATPDELDQGTLMELLRALRQAVDDAPDLGLMSPWNAAEVGIILDVAEVSGAPRRLEGEFVLTYAPYLAWEDENVTIEDVDDPTSVAEGLARAMVKVREMVNEFR
jgi:tetratricopeptide (TPR) repeat protein